ncbi:MAG: zf-HC2 domain-containing protein [Gemmatimonadota bacterium]
MSWVNELRRALDRIRGQAPADAEGIEGGISCEEAAERLYEWLDEELDPEMSERVGTHLEVCARCYPVLVFERSFREAVQRVAHADLAPQEVRDRILHQLASQGYEEGAPDDD